MVFSDEAKASLSLPWEFEVARDDPRLFGIAAGGAGLVVDRDLQAFSDAAAATMVGPWPTPLRDRVARKPATGIIHRWPDRRRRAP